MENQQGATGVHSKDVIWCIRYIKSCARSRFRIKSNRRLY